MNLIRSLRYSPEIPPLEKFRIAEWNSKFSNLLGAGEPLEPAPPPTDELPQSDMPQDTANMSWPMLPTEELYESSQSANSLDENSALYSFPPPVDEISPQSPNSCPAELYAPPPVDYSYESQTADNLDSLYDPQTPEQPPPVFFATSPRPEDSSVYQSSAPPIASNYNEFPADAYYDYPPPVDSYDSYPPPEVDDVQYDSQIANSFASVPTATSPSPNLPVTKPNAPVSPPPPALFNISNPISRPLNPTSPPPSAPIHLLRVPHSPTST